MEKSNILMVKVLSFEVTLCCICMHVTKCQCQILLTNTLCSYVTIFRQLYLVGPGNYPDKIFEAYHYR